MSRRAVTLVEILVVLGIISVMMSLLLPAAQAIRERARNVACQNQLRQIGIAITDHESSFKHIPAGGWGYRWVGDATKGFGPQQPGGWIFNTLPFLESGVVRDHAVSSSIRYKAIALTQPLPAFVCPSRSTASPTPYLGITTLHNADRPQLSFKADYAGNGGDQHLPNGPGPESEQLSDLKRYAWPHMQATGVFFARSQTKFRDVSDGLSNIYFVGEKYVRTTPSQTSEQRDLGNDQAALIGDDHDIRRWCSTNPRWDNYYDSADSFGSRHPYGWNALLGDGSIHQISFYIELKAHQALGNRRDGSHAVLQF